MLRITELSRHGFDELRSGTVKLGLEGPHLAGLIFREARKRSE